jgi:uncharacterized membrane protein YeaQ/YmgE (transglycosylase-associated protein family)
MHILWMMLIGLVAGALAKLIVPGKDGHSIFLTMLLGIVGAFVAGWFGHAVGWYSQPGQGPGLIASTLGAVVVLAVYHLVARRNQAIT